jgi:hypothetical protein
VWFCTARDEALQNDEVQLFKGEGTSFKKVGSIKTEYSPLYTFGEKPCKSIGHREGMKTFVWACKDGKWAKKPTLLSKDPAADRAKEIDAQVKYCMECCLQSVTGGEPLACGGWPAINGCKTVPTADHEPQMRKSSKAELMACPLEKRNAICQAACRQEAEKQVNMRYRVKGKRSR